MSSGVPKPFFVVTGVTRCLRAVKAARSKDAVKIADGLKSCADVIYRKSQKYVPVETGALKAAGKTMIEGVGFGAKATVEYWTPYAVFVHEDVTKFHAPPTCARFLDRAFRETAGTRTAILKRAMSWE